MKKKLTLIVIFLFLITVGFILMSKLKSQSTDTQMESKIENSIVIEFFDSIPEFVYKPSKLSTTTEVKDNGNYKAVINGSYFESDHSHSGLLIQNKITVSNLAPLDRQITGIVVLNNDSDQIQFLTLDEFSKLNSGNINGTVFQTGPYLVKDNVINTEAIENSINGKRKYMRTVIGITSSGKNFYAISKEPISLTKLAEGLLARPELKSETVSIMNLDGGLSTSVDTSGLENDFRTEKELPIFLAWK